MKLQSKYFDSIRVKPEEDRRLREELPVCQWNGCHQAAQFPAPKGRGRDGEYFHFCLEHVREYNKSYNYFSGMSDDEVAKFQKASITGHRPTWAVGVNSSKSGEKFEEHGDRPNGFRHGFTINDPLDVFGKFRDTTEAGEYVSQRPLGNMERKSLAALNLEESATSQDIKRRFKDLVKRHHPDMNGGDKRSENRLREIIQAYNYLKQTGLC